MASPSPQQTGVPAVGPEVLDDAQAGARRLGALDVPTAATTSVSLGPPDRASPTH